jgi:AAA+ superfamily predicted ATPase
VIHRLPKPNTTTEWQLNADGVLDSRLLPDASFAAQWEAVITDQAVKDELLSQAVLNFTLRGRVDRALVPLHGIILLVGPPGTGKTSLARGLASRVASSLAGIGAFRYVEVEPHALAGAALGRSQRAVTDLFSQTIAEAATSPLIVLLDEVETLAADRAKMSMEANPIDVHRATDAVLAQLDHLAQTRPNILFIATSNFASAIDPALLSRADLVRTIGLPNADACRAILLSTIDGLAAAYPNLAKLRSEKDVAAAAKLCVGLDGRQIRKLVVSACARRKEVALKPELLSASDILAAVKAARAEQVTKDSR